MMRFKNTAQRFLKNIYINGFQALTRYSNENIVGLDLLKSVYIFFILRNNPFPYFV